MSIDHITMLQIAARRAYVYAYEYTSNSGSVYHIKYDSFIHIPSNEPVYGIVRSGIDGKPTVVRILADVTNTFRPVDDIKYNWLIDTISNTYFKKQERLFGEDREAEHRLEHAQAMEKVKALQAHMSVDILTGLPNSPTESLEDFTASPYDMDDIPDGPSSPAGDMAEADDNSNDDTQF